ncbi:MAG: NAD(P)/FAD-dependent oxidoreductase [Candidatus Lokiarchaeota archaeon]|nr:NAD(P)/FAD-dependent oxidoreductase [Candidatus Lokiarchaeota archaeon]
MKYDIIIIGAGPAGTQCAIELAKQNLNVLIIEKESPGRYKPCGGGLTYKNYEFGKLPSHLVERNLDIFVFGGRKEEASVNLKENEFDYGQLVYRNEFDLYLQDVAVKSGAHINYQQEVGNIYRYEDRIEVEIKGSGEKIIGDVAVIATGAKQGNLLAKFSDLDSIKDFVFAIQGEYKLSEDIIDERFGGGSWNIYFDSNLIGPHGYAWIFTKKEGLTVGYLEKKVSKDQFKSIITKHPLIKEKMEGTIPKKIRGKHMWAAPIADRMSEYQYSDRILVIGEAAGVIDRFYYEGIWQARKTGQIAANTLMKAFKKRDFSRWRLKSYENAFRKELYLKPFIGIYDSRDWHHFYYHSGYLDQFVDAIITTLKDEEFMKLLMKKSKQEGLGDIFSNETLQTKIVENLQKITDKNTFNLMFKEMKRIIIN